jgi:hypothetical protein
MKELREKLKEEEHEPDVVSASRTKKGEPVRRYTLLWD